MQISAPTEVDEVVLSSRTDPALRDAIARFFSGRLQMIAHTHNRAVWTATSAAGSTPQTDRVSTMDISAAPVFGGTEPIHLRRELYCF